MPMIIEQTRQAGECDRLHHNRQCYYRQRYDPYYFDLLYDKRHVAHL